MDDLGAVMDAAGCERPAIFGTSEGGPMSILFTVDEPRPEPLRGFSVAAGREVLVVHGP